MNVRTYVKNNYNYGKSPVISAQKIGEESYFISLHEGEIFLDTCTWTYKHIQCE